MKNYKKKKQPKVLSSFPTIKFKAKITKTLLNKKEISLFIF